MGGFGVGAECERSDLREEDGIGGFASTFHAGGEAEEGEEYGCECWKMHLVACCATVQCDYGGLIACSLAVDDVDGS